MLTDKFLNELVRTAFLYKFLCLFFLLLCSIWRNQLLKNSCPSLAFLKTKDSTFLTFECMAWTYLLHFSFSKSDLGNLCQDMWNSAGNNLKIGKEIIIYSGTKSKPLITLTNQGKAKLRRDVFVKFKGELFRSILF